MYIYIYIRGLKKDIFMNVSNIRVPNHVVMKKWPLSLSLRFVKNGFGKRHLQFRRLATIQKNTKHHKCQRDQQFWYSVSNLWATLQRTSRNVKTAVTPRPFLLKLGLWYFRSNWKTHDTLAARKQRFHELIHMAVPVVQLLFQKSSNRSACFLISKRFAETCSISKSGMSCLDQFHLNNLHLGNGSSN